MAVTRLKRKGLRNKLKAKKRQEKIKGLTLMPTIKNVDVEKIKEEFAKKAGKKPAKEKQTAKEEKAQPEAKDEDTKAIKKEPAKAQVEDTKPEDSDSTEEKK